MDERGRRGLQRSYLYAAAGSLERIAFDFNYTWSHSIDNSSGTESGASTSGAVVQDAFNPNAFRGSSDFDMRHNITADVLYELPFRADVPEKRRHGRG